jgi:hypothetical protein
LVGRIRFVGLVLLNMLGLLCSLAK